MWGISFRALVTLIEGLDIQEKGQLVPDDYLESIGMPIIKAG
jgi:hypothetical protein